MEAANLGKQCRRGGCRLCWKRTSKRDMCPSCASNEAGYGTWQPSTGSFPQMEGKPVCPERLQMDSNFTEFVKTAFECFLNGRVVSHTGPHSVWVPVSQTSQGPSSPSSMVPGGAGWLLCGGGLRLLRWSEAPRTVCQRQRGVTWGRSVLSNAESRQGQCLCRLLVFSQTLSLFEFFDTTCGILNRTTEQKIHRLVLLVALRSNPTTKSKITVTTSALPLQNICIGR
jgi:hypothetical protein